jgi:hypothetical protein
MTDNDKHASLLRYEIYCFGGKFYETDSFQVKVTKLFLPVMP